MKTFSATYDRHRDCYGPRVRNFPDSYEHETSQMEHMNDPDWTVKRKIKRVSIPKYAFLTALFLGLFSHRLTKVAKYDALKRREQRAM